MPTSETQVYLQVSRRVQPKIDKVNSCQRAKRKFTCRFLSECSRKSTMKLSNFHKETFILFLQTEFCKTSHSLPFFLVNTSCKAVSLIVSSSMPFIWARLSLNRHVRALYLLFTSFSFIFHSLWQISFFVAM